MNLQRDDAFLGTRLVITTSPYIVYQCLLACTERDTKVLVPARCFPHERCNENDGTAWSAYATSISRKVARVTFAHARDAKGRPYATIDMQPDVLLYQE
jgi:hypothetical protein